VNARCEREGSNRGQQQVRGGFKNKVKSAQLRRGATNARTNSKTKTEPASTAPAKKAGGPYKFKSKFKNQGAAAAALPCSKAVERDFTKSKMAGAILRRPFFYA
jgi:hypothetical protein